MVLPASLLSQVERHGCFSGCYGSELDASLCLDPALPLEPALFISCRDCLTYKVGALRSLLRAGTTADQLAEEITQHMRGLRGFDLSFGGYHMRAGGFWLNAVYYAGCGVFLIDGSRSRQAGSDLDLLILSFRQGVVQPPDPRMLDPHHYQVQVVYVDFSVPVQPVRSVQDLMNAPQCRMHPASGYHRVTLAEFQPAAPAPPASALPLAASPAPTPGARHASGQGTRALRPGDICPVCHAEVRERPLFSGVFVGCLC